MKKEIALIWSDALRSGKYIQGTNTLKKNNCFCSLGVLTDLSNLGEQKNGKNKNVISFYLIGKTYYDAILPSEVMEWSGVKSSVGKGKYGYDSLVNLNDCQKKSFVEIADYIDANYQSL